MNDLRDLIDLTINDVQRPRHCVVVPGSLRPQLERGLKKWRRHLAVANLRTVPQKWPAPPWEVAGSFRWTQRLNLRSFELRRLPGSVSR